MNSSGNPNPYYQGEAPQNPPVNPNGTYPNPPFDASNPTPGYADTPQEMPYSGYPNQQGVYLSYNLSNHLAGGIAAKFITSYIASYHSIAVCVDLGLNYYNPENDLSLSAVARNLGGQLEAYDEEYEKLPFDLRVGISKRLKGAPLRLSATMSDLTHWDYKFINHLSAGIDILLSQQIWVGAGYHFRRANEMKIQGNDGASSHGAGLSFGGGIQLERFKLHLSYGKYHVSSSSIIANIAFNI